MLVLGNGIFVPSIGARFASKQSTVVGNCIQTPQGYQGTLGYVRKINLRASLGCELNMSVGAGGGTLESDIAAGYEFNLKHGTFEYK